MSNVPFAYWKRSIPTTFAELFGSNFAHHYEGSYSKPTATDGLWVDQGTSPGAKSLVEVAGANVHAIPTVGTQNGKTFPLYGASTFITPTGNDRLYVTPFSTLDGSNNYTMYGAILLPQLDVVSEEEPSLLAQQGNFEIIAKRGADNRLHLQASINNGLQFSVDNGTNIIDDGVLHRWCLTITSGTGRLYLDGVQIGSDVTGIAALTTGNANPLDVGFDTPFAGATGAFYLTGIATRGLNVTEVGYLFNFMAASVGTVTQPTFTSATGDTHIGIGSVVTVAGTGFSTGARVFMRTGTAISQWDECVTTFVNSTQLTFIVTGGDNEEVVPGTVDLFILNGNGDHIYTANAFTTTYFGALWAARAHNWTTFNATTGVWTDVVGAANATQTPGATCPTAGTTPGGNACVNFDGGDHLVGTDITTIDARDGNICIWGCLKNTNTGNDPVFFTKGTGAGGLHLAGYNFGGINHRLGSAFGINGTLNNLDDGNWHHFVMNAVADGTYELYIDGVLRSTGGSDIGTGVANNANALTFGADLGGIAPKLTGGLSNVAIALRGANANELTELFAYLNTWMNGAMSITAVETVDVAGGDMAVVTGTGFNAPVTAITIDGTSCPVFFILSDTKLIVQVPAKTSGNKTISLNAGAATGNIKYHDPADASTKLLLERGAYVGDTWSDRSATASHFTHSTLYAPEEIKEPRLNETSTATYLVGPAWTGLITASNYSITVMVRMRALSAPGGGLTIDNPCAITDSTGHTGLAITNSWIRWGHYDGAYKEVSLAAISVDEWHVVDIECNAGTLRMRVDGGAWSSTTAVGALTSLASLVRIGASFDAAKKLNGDVRVTQVSNIARGEAWFNDNLAMLRTKHGMLSAAGEPQLDAYDDVFDPSSKDIMALRGKNLLSLTDARVAETATPNVVEAMPAIASFDAVNDQLSQAGPITTYVSNAAGSIGIMFMARSAQPATAGNIRYTEEALFADANGNLSVTVSASGGSAPPGVTLSSYNGTAWDGVTVPCAVGVWNYVQCRWNGTTKEIRVNGGPWATLTHAVGSLAAGVVYVGRNFNASKRFNGLIAEVMTESARWSNTDADDLTKYTNAWSGFNYGGLGTSSYNPNVRSLTGWLKPGDHVSGSWPGASSAGSSASQDFAEATNPPAVYSHAAKRFGAFGAMPDHDGVNDKLASALAMSNFFSTGTGTISVLAYADTASADAGASLPYDNSALISNLAAPAWVTMSMSTAGARCSVNDGAHKSVLAPAALKAWNQIDMRWNGSILELRVNGGPWSSIATTGPTTLTAVLQIGTNYNDTKVFDGRIAEVLIANAVLTDAQLNDTLAGRNYDFGLSLGGLAPISFDRTALSCSLLLKTGNYVSGTWTGTASAGSSGGRNVTEATNPPRVSTGEHLTARMPAKSASQTTTTGAYPLLDGSNDLLDFPYSRTAVLGTTGWTTSVLVDLKNLAPDAGAFANQTIWCEVGQYVGLEVFRGGARVLQYNAAGTVLVSKTVSGITDDGPSLVQARWTGTQLEIRINCGPWASIAHAEIAGGGNFKIGSNYNATGSWLNGGLIDLLCVASSLSDTTCNDLASYCAQTYGVSVGMAASTYNPNVLAATCWLRAGGYVVGTWTGTASAGSSGTRNATQATGVNQPSAKSNVTSPLRYPLTLINASGEAANTNAIQFANPGTIPNNVWWLRAGDGVTLNSSGAVSSLADQSGAGDSNRNVSPPGTDKPTWNAGEPTYGGRPTIGTFNKAGSANDCALKNAAAWNTTYSSFTLGAIGHTLSTSSRYFTNESSSDRNSIMNDSDVPRAYGFDGTVFVAGVGGLSKPRSMIFGLFNGASSKCYGNTGVGATGNLTSHTLGNAAMTVGSYSAVGATTWGSERIAEIYAFSTQLGVVEIRTLRRYRDSYYGKAA